MDPIERTHSLDTDHRSTPCAGSAGPSRRGPLWIAHRGGNDRQALRRALTAGIDWVEADIWLHHGRLVARHDPALWRLPVTYSRWSLSLMLTPAIVLDTLLRATAHARTHVLIDLKGDNSKLPAALVEALRTRHALRRAALCGQEWEPLDAARALDPEVQVFFSIGRPAHLDAYLARRRDGTAPPVASCYHELLTPATIASLKEVGTTIIAWTVDSPARAQRLLAWGVDGITTNRYTMRDRLRPRQSAAGSRDCPRPTTD